MTVWNTIRPHLSWLVRFFHISFIEARSERQSSYLGILWAPLSTLIFTLMLALVFRQPHLITASEFYLYVLSGYALWSFIAATITSSTMVIQKRYDFAIHNGLTLGRLYLKLLIDRLFSMGMDLILVVIALIILAPGSIGVHLLLLPPLLLILALVSLAVAYLTNIAVIFFPDLDTILSVGVRLMFFVSPVFWGAEGDATGIRAMLIDYNPAAYFLSSFRQAFGVLPIEIKDWIVMIGISATLCAVAAIAYRRSNSFVRNLK
ncbi:ABC transporter [Aliihoeflea sp. 2WW]|uniref:ABC transporter permease n=1 Tax=Aliihoeflea sp. 2WW TaxID=1381123 RepID=UPI0004638AF2|nr:ABC transporter [Aliihoeflea sp. 2WW]